MGNNSIVLKLLEDQTVVTGLTLLITTACSFGVLFLKLKREQII